jgi:hypothetical protein
MTKRNRYTPIQIHANDPSDIFELNKLELAKAIVIGIQHGIRTKKKRVDFAKVLIKGIIVITLSIDSREFKELLEEQLQVLVDFEEYESCALVVKLQDKLNKQKI